MKKISAIMLVSLLLFGMFLNFDMGIENASAYTLHAPIYIDGNAEFTAVNGVSNPMAAGTEGDPYIIEGWDINANTANGIEIINTDVYFVIRDCYIHDGGASYNGIALGNVTNGEVWNSNLTYNDYGIAHYSSSSNNIISNNIIESNNDCGIMLGGSNTIVLNNSIHSNVHEGIWLIGGSNKINNNSISNNFHGISTSSSPGYNIISNNRIYSNNYYGIWFSSSESNTIAGNNISFNMDWGIYIQSSDDNNIYHNNIIGNAFQAFDDGNVNSWSLAYPEGGNYWDDYTGEDSLSGVNQDMLGSDGLGDTPYDVPGNIDAKDMYPLMKPVGPTAGDILITSHDHNDIVSGTILIEAAVTFPDIMRVDFYIDGTLFGSDDSSPYQYILDTTILPEDMSFEVRAEAVLSYGYFKSTSITLWVNNIVDIGSYITVSTLHPEYRPDEDASVLVAVVSPPYFETIKLDVYCVDPSGHPISVPYQSFPYDTEFRVIVSIPSDAELGTYTVAVFAYGFAADSLAWYATDSSTFLVSGMTLREQLEALNQSISGLILTEVMAALNQLNQTLSGMDLTELLDAIEYLNQTLPVKIDDLSHQLSGVNDSLQSGISTAEINILNELANVNTALANDIQNLLSSITDDIIGMNSSLSDELTGLLNTMTTDSTALRTWLDIVLGAIDTNLTDTRAVLESQMADLEDYMAGFNDSLQSDLGDIIADIQAHDSSSGENHSDIIDMLGNIQGDIGQTGIDDLKTMLASLTGNVSSFDQSIAADLQGVVDDISEFETGSAQRMDNISSTLGDLARWEDVLAKLEELDTDLETAEDDLSASVEKIPTEKEEGFGLTEGLLVAVLVLLILILLVLLTSRKSQTSLPQERAEPGDTDVEEEEDWEEADGDEDWETEEEDKE